MNETEDTGVSISPKFWFVLTVLLLFPLGSSFALYGAREARLIRAANLLAKEVEIVSQASAPNWTGDQWIEYLVETVPADYRADSAADPDSKPNPLENISIAKLPPTKTWQLVVSADDEERALFIDVYGPNFDQPFYTREVAFPEIHEPTGIAEVSKQLR